LKLDIWGGQQYSSTIGYSLVKGMASAQHIHRGESGVRGWE
jgi:hypothetical protein